uniref:LD13184p n=1 Tax=Drosophila melanogaster TaxID=7227 RepID=Q95RS7_DROME|nr:LD13184p [Drosophila melanogaster]
MFLVRCSSFCIRRKSFICTIAPISVSDSMGSPMVSCSVASTNSSLRRGHIDEGTYIRESELAYCPAKPKAACTVAETTDSTLALAWTK